MFTIESSAQPSLNSTRSQMGMLRMVLDKQSTVKSRIEKRNLKTNASFTVNSRQ